MLARPGRGAPPSAWELALEIDQVDSDSGSIYEWAGYLGDGVTATDAVERRIDAVYFQAARLLAKAPARRAVGALATALLERRTIPGAEAEEIIRKARRARA